MFAIIDLFVCCYFYAVELDQRNRGDQTYRYVFVLHYRKSKINVIIKGLFLILKFNCCMQFVFKSEYSKYKGLYFVKTAIFSIMIVESQTLCTRFLDGSLIRWPIVFRIIHSVSFYVMLRFFFLLLQGSCTLCKIHSRVILFDFTHC